MFKFRLDEQAKKNPKPYVINAYKNTQPKSVFDYETPDVQEMEFLSAIKTICGACGLKICTCVKKDPKDIYKEEIKKNQDI